MVKGKKTGKKKSGKSTSNVFSMFEQQQIQEFKEAFGMIDANRDGFIDKDDLRLIDYQPVVDYNEIFFVRSTYASLGVRDIQNEKLEQMMSEAPAAINFTGSVDDFRNHVSFHGLVWSPCYSCYYRRHVELFNIPYPSRLNRLQFFLTCWLISFTEPTQKM